MINCVFVKLAHFHKIIKLKKHETVSRSESFISKGTESTVLNYELTSAAGTV